ncbi:helix-turn-helix domain-containing protein [Alcaligenaceae bacterium SJ-26]|nr:helix-turn-helix domain-containing protein [Alcaligenaceae bacterium SJ-26]
MNTFGSRLRHARKLRGLTQQQLARIAGLSQSAVGNYESDQRHSSRALIALASALNIDPRWLDSGRGTPPGSQQPPPLKEPETPYAAESWQATQLWPFPSIDPASLSALSQADRQILESLVRTFIEACAKRHGSR